MNDIHRTYGVMTDPQPFDVCTTVSKEKNKRKTESKPSILEHSTEGSVLRPNQTDTRLGLA